MRLRGLASGSRFQQGNPRKSIIGLTSQVFMLKNLKSFSMNTYVIAKALLKTQHLKATVTPFRTSNFTVSAVVRAFRMNTYRKAGGVGGTLNSVSTFRLWTFDFRLPAAALLATLLTGCAVPLGPGFRLRSRQWTFQDAAAPSAPAHMRVTERMENTGNRPLPYLDVSLPTAIDLAKDNLTIRVDGKSIIPKAESQDPAAPFRVQFDPPWPVRQPREIVLEYDLATDPVGGGVALVTPDGFYLADPRALPSWLTPVGFFASGNVLSRDERFEVTLPADFRVLASGRQQRKRAPDGKFLYRFRTTGEEIPSFVIAGRYREQLVQTGTGNLLFWTFQPLDPSVAQRVAGRLTATAAAFSSIFGPFPQPGPLRVVEAPAGLFSPARPGQSVAAASFPQGLLLGPSAFEQGIAGEAVLQAAEAELARIWFGWRVPLRSDVDTLFGRGLGLFAVALAAEARGGQPARRLEIVRLLAEYDGARVAGSDGSLLQPREQSTPQQLAANALKAALFLADLDDLAGQNKFEEAMRRLQIAIAGRGLTLSLDDFRSSLETSTGNPMAGVFRQWLNNPGVPDGFRERYSASSPPPPAPRTPSLGYRAPRKRTAVAGLFRRQK